MPKLKSTYKTYLVGGAVRDQLLGLPINERDWVVVGATPEIMRHQGFRQVGRDFPVFLHPETHEEYALARTERKVGKGYTGFVCFADPSVTLEDDLKRRDLTINAIAKTKNGKLIDPYNGIDDLNKKILRHVSPAFSEDPLRILRVARFAARLGNFTVHSTTNRLMQAMVTAGEIAALKPERVWQEFVRALSEPYPYRFFAVLQRCGALAELFPAIAKHLPVIKLVLTKTSITAAPTTVRFATLFAQASVAEVKAFCHRWRVPNAYQELAELLVKHRNLFKHAKQLSASQLLRFLAQTDAFRRQARFAELLQAAALITQPQGAKLSDYLHRAYHQIAELPVATIIKHLPANKIKAAIQTARRKKLADFLKSQK